MGDGSAGGVSCARNEWADGRPFTLHLLGSVRFRPLAAGLIREGGSGS